MQIRVGTTITYRVEIADVVLNGDGVPVAGICNYEQRLIRIAAGLDRQQRRHALRHEVMHAFQWVAPGKRDEEQDADFAAWVSDELDQQLERMGGWAALDRLVAQHFAAKAGSPIAEAELEAAELHATAIAAAPGYVEPVKQIEESISKLPSKAGRAQCGQCETIVGDASIVTSRPVWSFDAGGRVVERTLYCPHCDHLQIWGEGVDFAGRPNGAVTHGPDWRGDREAVDAFLRDHPKAVGLIAGEC